MCVGRKCVCGEEVCVGRMHVCGEDACVCGEDVCVCREGRCMERVSVFFRHPEVGDRERVCGVEWDQQVVSFPTLPNIQF